LIARLEGVLREQSPTRIVVDVGGVGYAVLIPLSTFTELPDEGKTVALHIHTHAHEGAVQLFGFASTVELTAFQLLLRANRVGPKLAQTILSGITPAALLEAIRSGNVSALRAVPGIGTKMAERILLELRDRVMALDAAVLETSRPPAVGPDTAAEEVAREQTLSALLNLGYPRAQADRVLADAISEAGSGATLETLVRASLKRLLR
jgi:Holliday junction DNA helicase RuvA